MVGVAGGIDVSDVADFGAISPPADLFDIELMSPGDVGEAFGELAGDVVNGAGDVLVSAADVGEGVLTNIVESAPGAIDTAGSAVGGAASTVIDAAPGAFDAAGNALGGAA